MALIKLSTFLKDRLQQLHARELSITNYLKNKKSGLGRIQYTKEDLLVTAERIKETKAAIAGIEQWKQGTLEIL